MAAGGSGLGVALAGALLRDVDAAVDLVAVAAAGALVGYVAGLLQALVDLLVVLVGEVLGLIHEALLSPGLTRRLIAKLTARTAGPRLDTHALAHSPPAERQIVGLFAHGLSNTEIAAELTISHATAKTPASAAP